MGNPPLKDDSENHTTRAIKTSQIWQEHFTRNISWICIDRGVGIWKADILFVDIEELGMMDASEIYPRRVNAKDVLILQKGEGFIFP